MNYFRKMGLLVLVCLAGLTGCQKEKSTTVGVIVPLEHQAMDEIVGGLKTTLESTHPHIEVMVKNAQGDQTLQRTIIQQMIQQKTDLLVPIGTATSQMTLAMSKQQPVVSLAAYPDNLPGTKERLSVVVDEIPPQVHFDFMRHYLPDFKKVTVVYSSQDKCFHEVEVLEQLASQSQVQLQKLMVRENHELFTISQVIDSDSQAIFILKDHPIASSVQVLMRQAQKLQIPVITSDEGSIKAGGCFAVGVKEGDIGRQGAKNIAHYFTHQTMPETTVVEKLYLFVNPSQCQTVGIDIEKLKQVAKQFNYQIEVVS